MVDHNVTTLWWMRDPVFMLYLDIFQISQLDDRDT